MAAGVGKTYRMLQEGQAEAEAGRDVVIGYLEPHDRPETTLQAEGLERVPRRTVTYRDASLQEMDTPAVIRRAPELALVDEIAHTNAPGSEHPKRWQDVEDVLDAGIDVYSTVNVQHLESLNDTVAELTGAHMRETLPDAVLSDADEVVLIDLTPEALLARLRAGKVYPEGRVDSALANFFKFENLQALREMALRQVAEDVESKRLVHEVVGTRGDRVEERSAPQAIGERLLALVRPRARSQRIVRRAWRSAQRLGAELDLLWVKQPGKRLDEESELQLDALRRLASVLGAHLLIEEDDDLVAAVRRVAEARGSTYLLIGPPKNRPLARRFVEPLPIRLLEALPGVDLRIVADRTQRQGARGDVVLPGADEDTA
jgi:two-component system sensor histidine kinase KdpD